MGWVRNGKMGERGVKVVVIKEINKSHGYDIQRGNCS